MLKIIRGMALGFLKKPERSGGESAVTLCRGQQNWKDIEYFDEAWKKRIALMAGLIEEEKSVLDLGCGRQWLREFLPVRCRYYPVDYKPRSEDTIVCDFNHKCFPEIKADLAFISGSLEYIEDPAWFISQVAAQCSSAIVSYCSLEKFPAISERRNLAWVNDLAKQELVTLFVKQGMGLVIDAENPVYEILKFKKGTHENTSRPLQ